MLEQSAYVAQVVGVILILASLIYVARQVRQNTDTQIAASRQTTLTSDISYLSMCMEHPEAAIGLGHVVEEVRPTALLVMYLRIREFAWYQYQNGILDKTTWESYMAPTAVLFESDLAKRIWASDVIQLDAGFRAQIDMHLRGS